MNLPGHKSRDAWSAQAIEVPYTGVPVGHAQPPSPIRWSRAPSSPGCRGHRHRQGPRRRRDPARGRVGRRQCGLVAGVVESSKFTGTVDHDHPEGRRHYKRAGESRTRTGGCDCPRGPSPASRWLAAATVATDAEPPRRMCRYPASAYEGANTSSTAALKPIVATAPPQTIRRGPVE